MLEELNIKQLNLMSADNDMLAYTLKPQVKILGPKYGPLVQKILAASKPWTLTAPTRRPASSRALAS